MIEAFVYLWYDALNKMYYLGKHKGSPDDTYTHSSTIWESFTKDNIPEGVTRRILAKGTHEEICILEHELLVNRKKRCWNRYYNNSLGDPRYVDMSGENNPMYKHGKAVDLRVNGYVEYDKYRRENPKTRPAHLRRHKKYDDKNRDARKRSWREYYYRKKAERQGEGSLEGFLT